MAGAGYRLFNTGDVLTAAQVNTFLMEQTVMVFNDVAARTAALSGVVAEGMLSYLKSTKQVEVYNGTAWVASDDPNAIQNTIVDAKGDLISATGNDVPARLAVGNNGETLVADSSTSTGLRWTDNYGFTAGKNKLINGDFRINQRSFSSTGSNSIFTFDRWFTNINGTGSFTAQTFTPGAAPVAGYEAINFLRLAASSQGAGNYVAIVQRIEDVRAFANQAITISFWAKASSGTPKISAYVGQNFGSGGSAAVYTYGAAPATTTSWVRYSININVPSISGKTIGTSSSLEVAVEISDSFNSNLGAQNATIDIWGIQAEAGSVATAFQTATGTLAGELAAARRYYQRFDFTGSNQNTSTYGNAYSTTAAAVLLRLDTPMRVIPTSIEFANIRLYDFVNFYAITNLSLWEPNIGVAGLLATGATGLTQYRPYTLFGNGSGYVAVNAEL